jgi:Undecaprenyl-phosphate galactose phosphotransferase WbaP
MGFALLGSDTLAFSLATGLVFLVRSLLKGAPYTEDPESILLAALGALAAFSLKGLYPGIGISPVSEIRILTLANSAVALAFAALTFFAPSLSHFSRLSLLLFWLFSTTILPILRLATRYGLSRLPIWGEPVILFGNGIRAKFVYKHLRKRRMLGFDPVLFSAQSSEPPIEIECDYISLETLLAQPEFLRRTGLRTALLTGKSLHEPERTKLLQMQGNVFERLIKIPDEHDLGSLGVSALDLDGIFAFEVHQNLAHRPRRVIKRIVDICLTVLGSILALPVALLIILAIRLTSPGPALYRQTRIGKDGLPFEAWKFRTMVVDADNILAEALRRDPALQAEWQAKHKLQHDPRISPVGKFLRRFSLDELPQLWNILRGEMSLVGPRPIVQEEIPHYGSDFELYKAVQPGLTGLWQVSGRNNTTYEERVRLDVYYVRNWSIWMDIYILIKTIWVVLKQEGAY